MAPVKPEKEFSIAFVGYGEAAMAFVSGLAPGFSGSISAFDIKTDLDEGVRREKHKDYSATGVNGCDTVFEAIENADVVFSMVTANQALNAARSVLKKLQPHCLYFDCNSCAPDTKRIAAGLLDNTGARYVDVALMAPVFPKLHQTPMLVSGPYANDALEVIGGLEMSASLVAGDVGAASTIKMIRSVMIKGMEALTAECILAGRKAGVDDVVLETLEKTYPGFGWKDRAGYMLERMMLHGNRRAAEMREVAKTIENLGLDGCMSTSTTNWQQLIGDLELTAGDDDYRGRADKILAALAQAESAAST